MILILTFILIMSAQAWLYIFIFLIIFNFTFSSILDYINDKNWNDEIPESLKDYYDKNRYKKAKEYKKARGKISLISSLMSIIITLVILIFGMRHSQYTKNMPKKFVKKL